MPSFGYVLRRVGQSLVVIFIVYAITFIALFVLPGDPIDNKINNPVSPLPQSTADGLRAYYNTDKPAIVQFFLSLTRLARGDLGFSLTNGKSVADLIGQALGQTLPLAALALLFTVVLSLAIALAATFAPWKPVRDAARAVPVLSISSPSFLVGYVLIVVFSFQLGWVSSITDQGFVSLVLPAITLAFASSGALSQVLIQGLGDAASQPFVTVLTAKGVSQGGIVLRHVLKNGAIPSITLLALIVGDVLAGSVIVETVFNRTGLGYFTYTSVRDQDTPTIEAIVLIVSAVYLSINLITDLVYPALDPRITQGGAGGSDRAGGPGAERRRAQKKTEVPA
ncbi:ABC transporter permease [Leifsonia sp. NPDC102414]|uniref:ABC transporter permease n=1 Tax=Leifsonia sp. NPDC102414 TaxID=3364124 RepID=UPI0038007E42